VGKLVKGCCSVGRENIEVESPNNETIEINELNKNQYQNTEYMIYIHGGEFLMGTEDREGFPADGEGPIRNVYVNSFLMDQYAVTNKDYLAFVIETNYITDAEKFNWSFVFYSLLSQETANSVKQIPRDTPWWRVVEGADWAHPEGPDSSIEERLNHPVVHISWNDAMAYCKWANKRLPTEAEWEYAARGGLIQKKYPWGDELEPEGTHHCNVWQGEFPVENLAIDGFISTAPVDAYYPNGYGLYNMSGNVWEWCSDWFSPNYHINGPKVNPTGPPKGQTKSMRGGSYLCHKSYCNRYRLAARTSNTPDSSTGNLGFRCVKDTE
jgi:formylglycine-generating enzyme